MSPAGYYSRFELPDWFGGDPARADLLRHIWDERYPALFEDEHGEAVGDLGRANEALLDALGPATDPDAHRRHVYAAMALALAAGPTVESFWPDDVRPARAFDAAERFVRDGDRPTDSAEAVFPLEMTPPQELNEAINVQRNLLRSLDPEKARRALRMSLDDVLEGYAVFPGADGRRDLFNWWLTQVFPAAWEQRLPDAIYTSRWPWPPPPGARPPGAGY